MKLENRSLALEAAKEAVHEALPDSRYWGSREKKNGRIKIWVLHSVFATVSYTPVYGRNTDTEANEVSLRLSGVTFMPNATQKQIETALKKLSFSFILPESEE